jgi:dimethylamine/trimethylamine dehydrogenase
VTRPERYDVLFEPVPIGPKTMKNRFYQAPHCTGFGDVFPGGQAHHREVKADGGWAVVNTEATTISPEYDWAGQMTPSRLWDDDDARNWRLMVDCAHEHDALVGIELHAGGAFVTGFDSRLPARHLHGRLEDGAWLGAVIEMNRSDIRAVQRQYVDAAIRARDVGFDIVNIWATIATCTTSSSARLSAAPSTGPPRRRRWRCVCRSRSSRRRRPRHVRPIRRSPSHPAGIPSRSGCATPARATPA